MESPAGTAWLENCYEADGPLYQCTLSILLLTPSRWKKYKVAFFNRFIVLAHQRYESPSVATKNIFDTTVKEYNVYKSTLIFLGLIDCIYNNFFGASIVLYLKHEKYDRKQQQQQQKCIYCKLIFFLFFFIFFFFDYYRK